MVVPWPPRNFVAEWTTMSAPCSIGRSRYGRRHGVVHDQRDTGRVRGVGDRPDVEDVAARVAERLGEQRLGVGADRGPPGVEVVGVVDERHLDAEPGQRVAEAGCTCRRRGEVRGDDVVAGAGQRQQREGLGGLPGGQRHGGDTALQRGDALLEDVLGGVVDAGVDVAGLGEGEQVGGVLGVAEDERRRLVDRHRTGARSSGRGRRRRGSAWSRRTTRRAAILAVVTSSGVWPAVTESMGWLMWFLARGSVAVRRTSAGRRRPGWRRADYGP